MAVIPRFGRTTFGLSRLGLQQPVCFPTHSPFLICCHFSKTDSKRSGAVCACAGPPGAPLLMPNDNDRLKLLGITNG